MTNLYRVLKYSNILQSYETFWHLPLCGRAKAKLYLRYSWFDYVFHTTMKKFTGFTIPILKSLKRIFSFVFYSFEVIEFVAGIH